MAIHKRVACRGYVSALKRLSIARVLKGVVRGEERRRRRWKGLLAGAPRRTREL